MLPAFIHLPTHLGYLILFALIAAESAGAPVPGETALITGGVLAHHGQFHIAAVIAVAAAGAIVGDNIGHLIGRTGGRRLLHRPGPLHKHRRNVMRHGEPFFAKHGPKAVFLARWVLGVRVAAAWLAGINRMPWPTFGFWNAVGGITWAASVGLLAYMLGPTAERLFKTIGVVGVLGAVVLAIAYMICRRARARSAAVVQPSCEPSA
jgi:membrane protein DedA with SNARE-associated domain